jgi:hypothetical protein
MEFGEGGARRILLPKQREELGGGTWAQGVRTARKGGLTPNHSPGAAEVDDTGRLACGVDGVSRGAERMRGRWLPCGPACGGGAQLAVEGGAAWA